MSSVPTTDRNPETFFDVDIPLHDNTECAASVAQLVSGLLYTMDALAEDVGHDDVLQALAITTAVRKAMADVSSKHGCDIPLRLLDARVASADFEAAHAA